MDLLGEFQFGEIREVIPDVVDPRHPVQRRHERRKAKKHGFLAGLARAVGVAPATERPAYARFLAMRKAREAERGASEDAMNARFG